MPGTLKRVSIVFYLECDESSSAMSPSHQASLAMKASPGFVISLASITDATAEQVKADRLEDVEVLGPRDNVYPGDFLAPAESCKGLPPEALRKAWQRWDVETPQFPYKYTIEFYGLNCRLSTWPAGQREPIKNYQHRGTFTPKDKPLIEVQQLAAEQLGQLGRDKQQLKLAPALLAELLTGRKGGSCPAGCYLAYSAAWHGSPCDPYTCEPPKPAGQNPYPGAPGPMHLGTETPTRGHR